MKCAVFFSKCVMNFHTKKNVSGFKCMNKPMDLDYAHIFLGLGNWCSWGVMSTLLDFVIFLLNFLMALKVGISVCIPNHAQSIFWSQVLRSSHNN